MKKKQIKLTEHKSANCYVLISENGNNIQFISYNTVVLNCNTISDGACEYIISCSGLYSSTTRRQIGWFLKEYFNNLNYYSVKYTYEKNANCLGLLNNSKSKLI